MERLEEAQDAYRKMAEARNSVVVALGAVDLEIDVGAATPPSPCPAAVRAYAAQQAESADDGLVVLGHEQRLARALLLLDDELRRDGHGTLGCSSSVAR